MVSKRKPFVIPAAVAATVLLCGVIWAAIAERNAILRDGAEIVLKTRPVDPRDLLRGRYVRLDYEISTVSVPDCDAVLDGGRVWDSRGTDVYALLEPGPDGYHVVKQLTAHKPSAGVFLAGKVTGGIDPNYLWKACMIDVDYGIDRFYAAEKVAPEIEQRMRDRQITEIVAAVSDDGVAQIKALRQGETVIFTEPLL